MVKRIFVVVGISALYALTWCLGYNEGKGYSLADVAECQAFAEEVIEISGQCAEQVQEWSDMYDDHMEKEHGPAFKGELKSEL